MKDQFPGYFRPTEDDFKKLWGSGWFVLDASVLLNLYRYSDETRKEFIRVLQTLRDRLWLPHRAASEFFRNRLGVISQQERAYDEASKLLDQIEREFKNKRQHPFISAPLLNRASGVFSEIRAELASTKEAHRTRMTIDPILQELDELFREKIGSSTAGDELEKICIEGKQRYEKKIPPGYKDTAKDGGEDPSRQFGDLILWVETMKMAQAEQRSVILVIDDRKEDWWTTYEGKTIGPRPELIKEFTERTGKQCYMYQPDTFLSYAGMYGKQKVSDPALTELRELRKDEERRRKKAKIERIRQERALREATIGSELMEVERRLVAATEALLRYRSDYNQRQKQLSEDPSGASAEHFAELANVENSMSQLASERQSLRQEMERLRYRLANIREEFAFAEEHLQQKIL
jgi:hypothetical protein